MTLPQTNGAQAMEPFNFPRQQCDSISPHKPGIKSRLGSAASRRARSSYFRSARCAINRKITESSVGDGDGGAEEEAEEETAPDRQKRTAAHSPANQRKKCTVPGGKKGAALLFGCRRMHFCGN